MTNVSKTPQKVSLRRKLFELGERALEKDGWRVERIQGIGKSSVRRVVKGSERHTVSIRTTQDCWIAFPRKENDNGWVTLDDVDFVVAVTVDDKDDPKEGMVFMVEGDEMRERFDRTYRARLDAGHSIPVGRGVWVSMFVEEDPNAPSTVGGRHRNWAETPAVHDTRRPGGDHGNRGARDAKRRRAPDNRRGEKSARKVAWCGP